MKPALNAIMSQPWAILPNSLQIIMDIAERKNDELQAIISSKGEPLENTRSVELYGDIAVIPVIGPIFRYANLFNEISGATSLEILALDFEKAEKNNDINTIILNIDSPGGQAPGISEMAEKIRRSKKNVVAYVDGMAASAAYWLASAADEVIVNKTSELGSIGVVLSVDADEETGTVKFISSQSPLKQASPASKQGRAVLQQRVDALAQVFLEEVAINRNMEVVAVREQFGAGALVLGAETIARGMADSLSTFSDILYSSRKEPYIKNRNKLGVNMEKEENKKIMTIDDVAPDIAESLRKSGAEGERTRIKAVFEQLSLVPGYLSSMADLLWDGATTAEQAAVRILSAEAKKTKELAAALADESPVPLPHISNDSDNSSELPLDERIKADWQNNNKQCREEFTSFDSFRAYRIAESQGRIKIKTNRGE